MDSNNTLKQRTEALQHTPEDPITSLLDSLIASSQYPCFVLAPPSCGQNELVKTYLGTCTHHMTLLAYVVDSEGRCQELSRDSEAYRLLGAVPHPHTFDDTAHYLAYITQVPWLDDDAMQLFSDEIDGLVDQGMQVLISCPVQNDRYQNLQSDRLEIAGTELMQAGFLSEEDYLLCFKEFIHSPLPAELKLVAAFAALVGEISLEGLLTFGYNVSSDIPGLLPELCPLFSTTQDKRVVRCKPLAIQDLEPELILSLSEYLTEKGVLATAAVLASRITTLSVGLLERGDLELSHEILGFAEGLIRRSKAHGEKGNTTPRDSLTPSGDDENDRSTVLVTAHSRAPRPLPQTLKQMSPWLDTTTGALPPLFISLFGRFEVYLEGEPLSNSFLSRTKVRRFMSYLALNRQRAVSRDTLMEYLWPYLDFERAQKNLYTSWCMLAKSLGAKKVGDCPFIHRRGEIYQFNPELVVCDTHIFEESARTILFNKLTSAELCKEIQIMEQYYRNSLVADLPVDSFIEAKMISLRSLMVDSLLIATRQLRATEEFEKALFYARTAYELDETREDVYRELMDTQYVAGQRTSAMQTYFSCKRYLSDELGILPSKSTTALYQDVLLDSCR